MEKHNPPTRNIELVENLVLDEIAAGVEKETAIAKYFEIGEDEFGNSREFLGTKLATFSPLVPTNKHNFCTSELVRNGDLYEGYRSTLELLGKEYLSKIFVRTSGSVWNITPTEFFSWDWEEIKVPAEAKMKEDDKVFRTYNPGIEAVERILLLSDLEAKEVFFREGSHGRELVSNVPPIERTARRFYAFITEYKDVPCLATAYPGRFTASIKKYPNASIAQLKNSGLPFAVKSLA